MVFKCGCSIETVMIETIILRIANTILGIKLIYVY